MDSASPLSLVLIEDPTKRDAVGLVQIRASEITGLGMTIEATRIAEIRGHVSIPEMDAIMKV